MLEFILLEAPVLLLLVVVVVVKEPSLTKGLMLLEEIQKQYPVIKVMILSMYHPKHPALGGYRRLR